AKLFRSVLDAAREFGAAVPGLMPKETVKQLTRDGFVEQTYTRSLLSAVQTPQVFERALLVEAYTEAMQDRFVGTDDASLVEYFGSRVRVVQGEEDNIKITTQLDFRLAELILSSRMA
ncbi:MAG: 2-C-methyl-D-erythritol 4-phosphate cytidylyltransferase, partial [Candidatus Kapabacteria bacterium]|nr:2-C-methyl-D-erythritol 4-phosphate cytidylyltransferase [Candidatus Kapabacteria bacterium]